MTLADEINIMIKSEINSIPYPIRATITKVYDDNKHTDISTDLGDLEYVETIGNNLTVNNKGVLIFLNGNTDEYILLTK